MPDRGLGLDDALNPRMAGSTEGMTLQVLAQIRDSLSAMSRKIDANNEATGDVRERVIRLEERDKRLEHVELTIVAHEAKIAVLMTDKAQRTGAMAAFGSLPKIIVFLITIGSLFSGAYLFGRSVGIVPSPPVAPLRLEATGNAENQRIEGTVGGKP